MSGTSMVIEIMRAAKWHAEHNYKPNDRVVVVTTPTVQQEIPIAFAAAWASMGAEVVTVYMKPPLAPGEEPPKAVADTMKSVDVAITCCNETLSFSNAMIGCIQNGGRHLSVPGAGIDTFRRGIIEAYFDEREFQKMRSRALWLADLLKKAKTIRVTTPKGTDISGNIDGRLPLPAYSIAEETYNHASFPSGEVMIAPIEGTAEGIAIIDTSMGGIGKINTPIKLTVKEGKVVKIEGGEEAERLRKLVERSGEGADNLAEFGIGINHKGIVTGNKNEDKKIAGTAHVALGDNHAFGGRLVEGIAGEVEANVHLDGVMQQVTIYVDGEKIVDNGRLLF
ncbi:MAG: aminopeptidase [Clostridia bacterium]|nr:aminopeptidase [Clostridia bacterium]